METTLPPVPPPIVDGRRDFIETYKNELIAIGILSGFLVVIVLYLVYRRFTAPTITPPPLQVKKQQVVVAPLPITPSPPLQIKKQQVVVAPLPITPSPPLQVKKQQVVVAPLPITPSPPLQVKKQQVVVAPLPITPSPPLQVKKQQVVVAPQVKKQQQKIPPLKNVNNRRIRANLPAINNPISTGFSNQFHQKK